MLAHDAQGDFGGVGEIDHLASLGQVGSNGLLQHDGALDVCAKLNGFEMRIREAADVYVIDARMLAQLRDRANKLGIPFLGELVAASGGFVVAGDQFEADVFIGARVHVGDGAGADETDSQSPVSVPQMDTSRPASRKKAALAARALRAPARSGA